MVARRPHLTGRACVNYAATVSITSYETMGWLRTAVGIALIAAPGAPMRLSGRQEPTGADLLLMRTIGIRDSLSAAILALTFVCGDLQARRRIPVVPEQG